MKRQRRWTIGPFTESDDVAALLERLVDLSLLDPEALLERDPELKGALARDLDDALAAADAAVGRLMARAVEGKRGKLGRLESGDLHALASRIQRCAASVQERRDALG